MIDQMNSRNYVQIIWETDMGLSFDDFVTQFLFIFILFNAIKPYMFKWGIW